MNKIFNMMAIVSVIGAHVISINVNIMHISFYRGLLVIAFLLFIILYLASGGKKNLRFHKRNRYVILFNFIWLGYSILTVLWVKDYGSWLKSIFFIASGAIVLIMMVYFIDDKKKIIDIFKSLFLMVLMNNIIGWYEVKTSNYMFLDEINAKYYAFYHMPVSMLGNANDFGLLMLFGVFISGIVFYISKSKLVKAISIGTMGSSIFLCYYANSRANLIGIGIGIITYLIIRISRENAWNRLWFMFAATFIIVLIFFFQDFFPDILSDKLYFTFDQETGSDSIRLNLIRNGLLFLMESIGFGVGAGNIEYWMTNAKIYYVSDITNMHNWWFEILVGYGIIIFLGYIKMYIYMFKRILNIYQHSNDKQYQHIAVGVLCIMMGFVVGSISSSSNINKEWLWFFWGLIVTLINYYDLNETGPYCFSPIRLADTIVVEGIPGEKQKI